jgi:hypothetical protein
MFIACEWNGVTFVKLTQAKPTKTFAESAKLLDEITGKKNCLEFNGFKYAVLSTKASCFR